MTHPPDPREPRRPITIRRVFGDTGFVVWLSLLLFSLLMMTANFLAAASSENPRAALHQIFHSWAPAEY